LCYIKLPDLRKKIPEQVPDFLARRYLRARSANLLPSVACSGALAMFVVLATFVATEQGELNIRQTHLGESVITVIARLQ
jgi:hypothetical protein